MHLDLGPISHSVAELLRVQGGRKLPLIRGGDAGQKNRQETDTLVAASPAELFPGAREPQAALAGLLLYLDRWSEAHNVAQDLNSQEGSYWHAIVHRMEPDAGNANYWFNRVGTHAIFTELQSQAEEIVNRFPASAIRLEHEWSPKAFIDICESAHRRPGSELETAAVDIQFAEWQLLMQWCTRRAGN